MSFDNEHDVFLQDHMDRRSGERKGALLRGHGHGNRLFLENVWWPMFRNFDQLHPEYEVYDFNRRSRYLDFALIRPHFKIAIEIDGYTTHIKDMDREGFRNELNRQSFLVGLGWDIFRCAFDDVKYTPEVCKQLLQLIIGKYMPVIGSGSGSGSGLGPGSGPGIGSVNKVKSALIEKEIIRFACSLGRPLRSIDVREYFRVDYRTARKWIQSACIEGWLGPIKTGNGIRIRYYELNEAKMKHFW